MEARRAVLSVTFVIINMQLHENKLGFKGLSNAIYPAGIIECHVA